MSDLLFKEPELFFNLNLFLDVLYEGLGWFESWDIVRRDKKGGIFRDIPACFLCPLLYDKAAKSTKVDVFAVFQTAANCLHERFYSYLNISIVHSRSIGNFGYNVSLGHEIVLRD